MHSDEKQGTINSIARWNMQAEELPVFLDIAKDLLKDARVWDMQKYIQHGSIRCL